MARTLLVVTHRPPAYGGGGSTRWRFFGEALEAHGWRVATVAARPNATADAFSTNPAHARLARARAAVTGRVGAVARPLARRAGIQPEALAPSALWALTGRAAVRRAIAEHRPDAVVATSPPVAAHLVLAGLAREIGVPIVMELRDNWAGNPYYDAGGRALTRIERRALEPAAAIVCVTPEMGERLARLHPGLQERTHVLPNGFDPRILAHRRPRRPREPATLVHAGAVYGTRDPAPLVAAMRTPRLRGRCRLELIGPGALQDVPPEVVLTPSLPWEEAIQRQAQADVGVILYSDDVTARPGKLYELLALGKPVLALADPGSGTDRLLRDLGQSTGIVPPHDVEAIARALAALLDAPPPPVEPERLAPYDRGRVTERFAALLDEVVA